MNSLILALAITCGQPQAYEGTTVLPPQLVCRGGVCYYIEGARVRRKVQAWPRPVTERRGPLRRCLFGRWRWAY